MIADEPALVYFVVTSRSSCCFSSQTLKLKETGRDGTATPPHQPRTLFRDLHLEEQFWQRSSGLEFDLFGP